MYRSVGISPDIHRALRLVEFYAEPFENDDPKWPAWGEPDLVYRVIDREEGGYEVIGWPRDEL